jgi:hypothetical protein
LQRQFVWSKVRWHGIFYLGWKLEEVWE